MQVVDHVAQSQYALELLLSQADYAGALDIMTDIQVSTTLSKQCSLLCAKLPLPQCLLPFPCTLGFNQAVLFVSGITRCETSWQATDMVMCLGSITLFCIVTMLSFVEHLCDVLTGHSAQGGGAASSLLQAAATAVD